MLIIGSIVGNAADAQWKTLLRNASIDYLALNQWDAQKNRFRKKSEAGVELAVSLDRNCFLRDGDILTWDAAGARAVVARVNLREVMVVELEGLPGGNAETLMRICVELGHALGNQHWPAVVKKNKVFVPLTVDKKVMSSVMNTHAFDGIHYGFFPGTEVIPYLLPHESRRLFGGAEQASHSHPGIEPGEAAPAPAHRHVDGTLHAHAQRRDGHDHHHHGR